MDPAVLQANIQPLTTKSMSASAAERAYFSFYDIDFENHQPDVRHHFGYVDSCNYRIACHLYLKPQAKGSVYLIHGYYDHVGLFAHVIRFLLEQGYNVFAYDLPGHGLSSGKPATIPDFSIYSVILEDLQEYCEELLPKPWLGYGQSTGGAILTDFLVNRVKNAKPLSFDQLILSAPLVRPYLWKIGRIQLYILRLFVRQIPRKFTSNSNNDDFLNKARRDPLAPKILPTQWVSALDRWIRRIESFDQKIPLTPLVIQGTRDTTIDADHNIQIIKKLYSQPEVLWLNEARHHLPNELLETRKIYMNWLTCYL